MTEPSAPSGGSPAQPSAPPAAPPTGGSAAPSATAPAAPAAPPAPTTEVKTPAKPGVKTRFPYQRACNEKDAKGKLCAGHLKRWHGYGEDIKRQYGANAEIYRCEYCQTLYLPAPGYDSRSGTLQF
ncbi:MAG: hypothetical protein HY651_03145 [Acidobacteria bacterium]|nr:hypothetical protein [Acidobacteriota bacterium]